ncbi:MAG: cupin domain-containing protein [Pigmentiphaga sp.]|nr:cupin domain-containing protein [Pigmentiphaga sp.]
MTQKLLSTIEDYQNALTEKYAPGQPSFFTLSGPLPASGRTDTVLAATPTMTAILKCYAECGENTLHAHTTEDHLFIVLQGEANFYGPNGELKTIGPLNGVMLPHGTFYRFRASAGEPLVMVRVGAAALKSGTIFDRIGMDGKLMEGNSKENQHEEPVLSGKYFGPV